MKEQFLKICESIKREGMKELLNYLEKTDFYTAPSSTHYHGAEPQGLLKHSLSVRNQLLELENDNLETLNIISLFHDVCKINCYQETIRNVKKDGVWVQVPYYQWNNDRIVYGHGEESVLILERYIKLTLEEKFSIRYHMGAYMQEDIKALQNVYREYPIAYSLHIADMKSMLYHEN